MIGRERGELKMLIQSGAVSLAGVRCAESLINDRVIRSAFYVDTTDSTNSLAMAEVSGGRVSDEMLPRLFITDRQTAGRGRLGRTWSSAADSLTFSLAMSVSGATDAAPLSLLAGVMAAEAIDALVAPVTTQLKWPNDIYISGQKVGGILIEASGKYPHIAVVGIGINVLESPAVDAPGFVNPASLATFSSRPVDRFDVLDEILRRLHAERAATSIVERFRHKCYLQGQPVSLDQSGKPLEGVCEGIDSGGRLVINTGDAKHTIHSGEASLIRRH